MNYKIFIYDTFTSIYKNNCCIENVNLTALLYYDFIFMYYVHDIYSPTGKSIRYDYRLLLKHLRLYGNVKILDFRTSIK